MGIEINNMIFPGWIIAVAITFILLIIQFRRRKSWPTILCQAVFSVYLLKALDVTFFPVGINGSYVDNMRTVPITSFINLIPFYIGQAHLFGVRDFIDFAENILLTIPFGFGILFVSKLRPKDFLWLPLAIGFGIETAQLIISLILRYPYRVIDINDTLLNAFGVVVGYGLFRIFAWLFFRITQRLKPAPGGWLAYVQEVIGRA
jgi:glycopeptide antibiotics resistance protein